MVPVDDVIVQYPSKSPVVIGLESADVVPITQDVEGLINLLVDATRNPGEL